MGTEQGCDLGEGVDMNECVKLEGMCDEEGEVLSGWKMKTTVINKKLPK